MPGPAQEVVDEIKKAGGQAIASTLSITEPQNADEIVKAALDAFGRVDILVNNAGILRDTHLPPHELVGLVGRHRRASARLVQHEPRLRRRISASRIPAPIVHMTSTSGLIGNFGQANYMAAKLGIIGLSRGIALDMARFNVRSNCIAPFAWTRMIGSIPTETDAEKERVARLQQMTPEKIAPLVVYLGSDQADGISGQIFSVRNNEIFLFNQPRPIRALHRSDGWTPEKLDAQLKGAFGPSLTPLDRSGDVFSWDPVLMAMAIVYDKLLALKIPATPSTAYTRRRTRMLYALGVGLGHDPTERGRARLRLREEPQGAADLRRRARLSRLLGARSRHRHRLGEDRQRRAGLHAARAAQPAAAP